MTGRAVLLICEQHIIFLTLYCYAGNIPRKSLTQTNSAIQYYSEKIFMFLLNLQSNIQVFYTAPSPTCQVKV